MKRILLSLGLLACLTIQARADDATKETVMNIEGTWIPQEAQLGGQPFPEAILKMMSLSMAGGEYTVSVGGKLDKGTFALGPDEAKPRAIDITGVEGPNQGKTFAAIFEQDADTLRVCYDLSGQERPTAFATAAGTQQFLVRYVRSKP